jgi:hypothetical protein
MHAYTYSITGSAAQGRIRGRVQNLMQLVLAKLIEKE